MKNASIVVLGILLAIGGAFWYFERAHNMIPANTYTAAPVVSNIATILATTTVQRPEQEVIGKSVQGRDISAYHFGTGSKEILVVSGIHGGYEWNTVLVANDLINYLKQSPETVPADESVTVIPILNPDGLAKVVDNSAAFTAADITASQSTQIAGRFNANQVDLNRNFDCDWQANGVWQNTTESGGTGAFSELESRALESYITSHHITAAVVFYSSAGGVYASSCHNGVLPATQTLVRVYSNASGYPPYQSFNFYTITGDAVNWMAKENIPAISVLLSNHTGDEWIKNKKGIEAVLAEYSQ